jgi:hypothetical protein
MPNNGQHHDCYGGHTQQGEQPLFRGGVPWQETHLEFLRFGHAVSIPTRVRVENGTRLEVYGGVSMNLPGLMSMQNSHASQQLPATEGL